MNRGAARQAIFFDDWDRRRFLALLGAANQRYGLETHAFCLMGNHYHLLVRTPEPTLGISMQYVNGLHARWVNDRRNRDGSLFRGRFASVLIESDAQLLQASRYIHLNPVEAGLVERPEQYQWSSFSVYLDGVAPPWVECGLVLGIVGGPAPRLRYSDFVTSTLGQRGAAGRAA